MDWLRVTLRRNLFKIMVETIPLTAASEETPITFVSKEQDCGPGQPGNPLGRRKERGRLQRPGFRHLR